MIGDPVNLAAKLEKHTKAERVRALCTAAAYQLALSQGYRPRAPPSRAARRRDRRRRRSRSTWSCWPELLSS